jgi:thiol-disulfide isomerase/thioredoxin
MNSEMSAVKIWLFILFFLTLIVPLAYSSEDLTDHIAEGYSPKAEAVKQLHVIEKKFDIVLFHGAWCPDCRNDVPKFMKILAVAGNSNLNLIEHKVDRNKRDVLGKFEEFQIRKVPTYVVLHNGVEIGRVVKAPKISLEEDLLAIIQGVKS